MDYQELIAKLEQENAELMAQIMRFLARLERLDAFIDGLLDD